ncbi:MAG: EF-hand domain-containing protein [Candidatus Latescibacterota bacterium]|jgi:Ca2+-binding EF-hand superfamily protein
MTQMRPSQSRADRAAELFKRVDQNGDGGVDQAEFSEWAAKMAERDGATAVDATTAMTEMDQDGDGLLSQTELDSGMPALMKQMGGAPPPPPPPENGTGGVTDLFAALDESGDGAVDETELSALIDAVSTGESATTEAADKTGLSALLETLASSESTASDVTSLFGAADVNGDGLLSQDELLSALAPQQSTESGSTANQSGGTDNLARLWAVAAGRYMAAAGIPQSTSLLDNVG